MFFSKILTMQTMLTFFFKSQKLLCRKNAHKMAIYRTFKIISINYGSLFKPFKPEFTIVIFIHYKQRIAVAILDL